VSGKPFFAIEPSVPIMFELTILLAAIGCRCRHVRHERAAAAVQPALLFRHASAGRPTTDSSCTSPRQIRLYDAAGTERMLLDLGALNIESITDNETASSTKPDLDLP
jgi:hypothetical protein